MTGTDATRFDVLTPNVVKKGDTEIGIIREFDFTPQLQRMSVVVRCLESTEMLAYCKGAPEKIRPLCNNVPEDYDKILDYFTVKGFRVIGLAWKKIEGVNWHQLQKMSRDKVSVLILLVIFISLNIMFGLNLPSCHLLIYYAGGVKLKLCWIFDNAK